MALIVAFDANGSVMTLKTGGVKIGNKYLHCMSGGGEEANSSVQAMLPFDAILYIVDEKANLSHGNAAASGTEGGISDPSDVTFDLGDQVDDGSES